jgi:hypothetical protein
MFDLKAGEIYNRPMSFQFRGCTQDQPLPLPPSLQEWLPDGHLRSERFQKDDIWRGEVDTQVPGERSKEATS